MTNKNKATRGSQKGQPAVPDITNVQLTPEISKKVKKLCDDAMTILLWKVKLYSQYVLRTKFIEAPQLNACMGIQPKADCLEVFYNPLMIEAFQWTIKDAVETLKHEYGHILLRHCWVSLPDHTRDNIAADIEINQDPWVNLSQSTFLVKYACTYDKYGLEDKKSRETYYNELLSEAKNGAGEGGGNGGTGVLVDGNNNKEGTPSPVDEHTTWKPTPTTEEVWRRITQEMLTEAKTQGTLPGDAIEYIEARWKKCKPLEQVLKRIAQKCISMSIREGETRTRPNRRFPLLPGVRDQYGPKIVWAIDTSGSMESKELEIIMSVARWLSKRIPFDLIQCDAEITAHQKQFTSKNKKIGLKGRGGTSFKPVFKYIEETYKNKIDLLVFGTDLDGDFPEETPKYKVVWLATSDKNPPFGEVIRIREKK